MEWPIYHIINQSINHRQHFFFRKAKAIHGWAPVNWTHTLTRKRQWSDVLVERQSSKASSHIFRCISSEAVFFSISKDFCCSTCIYIKNVCQTIDRFVYLSPISVLTFMKQNEGTCTLLTIVIIIVIPEEQHIR